MKKEAEDAALGGLEESSVAKLRVLEGLLGDSALGDDGQQDQLGCCPAWRTGRALSSIVLSSMPSKSRAAIAEFIDHFGLGSLPPSRGRCGRARNKR
jgi:hypothetical protein